MIDPAYERALHRAFANLHNCEARWAETVAVKETWQGKIVWEGDVEVFYLAGHPTATKGYAWAYDKAKGSEIVAVLELPPVMSAETAVQASIVAKVREQARN
jgi:flavin-dependent dehydrogenase